MAIIKAKRYSIIISSKVFKSVNAFLQKKKYSGIFILCDTNTLRDCLPSLITGCPDLAAAQIIELESGEASKSMEVCAGIWQTLLENKADKRTLIINLGGGVISDLGGFIASVYKRGVDFINLPTSLLAMADASVGGKTGIDFAGIKNALGSFAEPQGVFVNPVFLNTLPKRHYQNGLGEVFKMALVASEKLWVDLKSGEKTPEQVIHTCISLKNKIVQQDPFDQGRRKILNFGHTIGHAVEALTIGARGELLHGEAVVAGMLIESHIALQKKIITKTVFLEVCTVLQGAFRLKSIAHLPLEQIIDQIANDKKADGNKLKFALIRRIGACSVDLTVTVPQIKKALSYYNQLTA